jgi:hypothetical protein
MGQTKVIYRADIGGLRADHVGISTAGRVHWRRRVLRNLRISYYEYHRAGHRRPPHQKLILFVEEQPLRRSRWTMPTRIGAGIAAAIAVALVSFGIAKAGGFPDRAPDVERYASPDVMWDWNCRHPEDRLNSDAIPQTRPGILAALASCPRHPFAMGHARFESVRS